MNLPRACLLAISALLACTQPDQGQEPQGARTSAVVAHEFYVSPNGHARGQGTKSDPWDLATALHQPRAVRPGDTIWLRGGTYGDSTTYFVSTLTGTRDAPIIVRQAPGERATIDGGLAIDGANAWYWGFEVMSSARDRTGNRDDAAAGRLDGFTINGPNTRFINLIVHDTREGFGVWTPASGAEVYGCIIYNNGWQGPDRGHGHGIYTQNRDERKHLGDNIIFNQFGLGIQAYGSSRAVVHNYLLDHNVLFNNGSLARDGRVDNVLFGFGGSLAGIRLEENYTYHTPAANKGSSRIGWSFGGINQDLTAQGNYFIGGYFALEVWNWATATFTGNTMYSVESADIYLKHAPVVQSPSRYRWDGNRYFGSGRFYLQGDAMGWDDWKRESHLDANSTFTAGPPDGTWTFVHENRYEEGRANIVVYNWDHLDTVAVDVAGVLTPGSSFEVRDAENYFGAPVLSGKYEGGSLAIPMKNLRVAQPVGTVPNPPEHTAPEFGVFVLLPR